VFEAFCLQIVYDKPNRRIEISATITEAIGSGPRERERPPGGGLECPSEGHSRGGIRTRDVRVMSPTGTPTANE
jgi:hypothetical protein